MSSAAPFSWAEELMLFLMILSVFAGAIAVTWRNLHIRIDTFIDRAPPAVRRIALSDRHAHVDRRDGHRDRSPAARIVALLYDLDQRSDALSAPAWIPQSFVTIGLGTIALIMAVKLVTSRFYAEPPAPTRDAAMTLLVARHPAGALPADGRADLRRADGAPRSAASCSAPIRSRPSTPRCSAAWTSSRCWRCRCSSTPATSWRAAASRGG